MNLLRERSDLILQAGVYRIQIKYFFPYNIVQIVQHNCNTETKVLFSDMTTLRRHMVQGMENSPFAYHTIRKIIFLHYINISIFTIKYERFRSRF